MHEEAYPRDRNFDTFSHLRLKSGKSVYPKERIETLHWTELDRVAIEEYNEHTRDEKGLPALPPYRDGRTRRPRRTQSAYRYPTERKISQKTATKLFPAHNLATLKQEKLSSQCWIKMKFLGTGGAGPIMKHHVSIEQQPFGGNTKTVFSGDLSKDDEFEFISRRHLDFPFSLTIYVDNKVDCRVSVCCEYKHSLKAKIGAGTFQVLSVEGEGACFRCAGKRENSSSGNRATKTGAKRTSKRSQKPQSPPKDPLGADEGSKPNESYSAKQRPMTSQTRKKENTRRASTSSSSSLESKPEFVVTRLTTSFVLFLFKNETISVVKFLCLLCFILTNFCTIPFCLPTGEPDDRTITINMKTAEQVARPVSSTNRQQHNVPLLATLTQEPPPLRTEQSTTAVVRLPSSDNDQPVSPAFVRSSEELSDNIESTPRTPKRSPTVTPLLSPAVSNPEFVKADESPMPSLSPRTSITGVAKKSVSFNEVREERQISDDEAASPEPFIQPRSPPVKKQQESDDEDDDPNAVENHEAALAIEDQLKMTEDKTPFLQPNATVLDLNKRPLNDRQVRRLCAEILNHERLEKIVIRECGLNDGMVQRLCDALQHSSNNIRLLCLNLNAVSAAGVIHIVQLLHSKPSVKMLLLYGNPLGDNGVNALVDGIFGELPEDLVNSLTAQGIHVPNQQDDEPVKLQLTHLDLGEMGISSAGAIKLSKLLERLPTLRVLNLGGNHNVGLEGWSAISKSLSDKNYPAKLCLSHCRLGNKCTSELAMALRTNTGVEHIDLEGCGIGEEGGIALLELADSNPPKLQNIVLTDNRVPELLLQRIDDVLRRLRGEYDDDEEDE